MTRKRNHAFYMLNCKSSALSSSSSSSDSYQFKKSKHNDYSPMMETQVSLFSKFHQYPEFNSHTKREQPHKFKFGGFQNSCSSSSGLKSICSVSDSLTSKMWSSLKERLIRAREAAFGSLRFYKKNDEEGGIKDDEVVNVDDDDEVVEVVNVEDDEIMEDENNKDSMFVGTEKMLDSLSLTGYRRHSKVEVEKILEEAFKPLTEEEENQVTDALSNYQRQKLLVAHESSNIDITVDLIRCLRPQKWLNDEVINLYLELLKERENRHPQKFLKCHFFNTFFYQKLTSGKHGYNFQSVRRWTIQRNLGYYIFDCDMIFVPIHKEVHWCLAVINKKEEKFQYLDSLGHADSHVMEIVARYFVDEVKEKNGKEIDVSSWKHEFVEDLPKQMNGYDCGVFMIKYIDFYSRGIGLRFRQGNMPYFRQRTASEILKLKAE